MCIAFHVQRIFAFIAYRHKESANFCSIVQNLSYGPVLGSIINLNFCRTACVWLENLVYCTAVQKSRYIRDLERDTYTQDTALCHIQR